MGMCIAFASDDRYTYLAATTEEEEDTITLLLQLLLLVWTPRAVRSPAGWSWKAATGPTRRRRRKNASAVVATHPFVLHKGEGGGKGMLALALGKKNVPGTWGGVEGEA